jgi:hypothetical protein
VGLTFLNAAFLFAAFAALLPLIIHMISRRRVETVEFSSLRFLKELERRKIRRVRIRQILLLVIRSLIILAVALALARPTLSGPLARGAGHAKTSVAIVLDQSASMSREGGGGSLLDAAVSVARSITGLLDEGDQAFLVTAGTPVHSLIPSGTFSTAALAQALDAIRPGPGATDYAGAVSIAVDDLTGARNLNREIYVIGDMQATGWSPAPGADAVPVADELSAANVRTYVIPVSGQVGNAGVAAVTLRRRYGGAPGTFSIVAEVGDYGRTSLEIPVRLFIDGVQTGQAGADIEPGGSAGTSFTATLDESAWHAGRAEIPPDVLASDNERFFVVPPARGTEVLIVRAEGSGPRDDAYYLEHALNPGGKGGRIRPVVIGASALAGQEQGRFPVVILADAGRLGSADAAWLTRHVEGGDGLLVVLGSHTDIRGWNERAIPGSALLTLREPVDRPDGVRLAPAGQGHPLLDGLVYGERLIDDLSVRRTFRVDGGDVETVLELPGVGPALVIGRAAPGEGEVAVLLTGIDPEWSDLPRSGLLVPLSQRLVERLSGSFAGATSVTVGRDLSVPVDPASSGAVDVSFPDGTRSLAELRSAPRATATVTSAAETGIYRFTRNGREIALGAVNPDPRESDLVPADRATIEGRLAPLASTFIDASGSIENEILRARRGRELWRVFVYIALALLALEMFIARPRVA